MGGDPVLTHICPYRVCYADSDQMGRVYYANYFVFAERARTEFMREAGCSYRELEAEGVFLPVRQCAARYFAPAVYDDWLLLRTHVERLRHATATLVTHIGREDAEKPLAVVTVELACIGTASGRPRPLPEKLRAALAGYIHDRGIVQSAPASGAGWP